MAGRVSLAEHYRSHRQAFALALELGCTPREAEEELARLAARDRCAAANARLSRLQHPTTPTPTIAAWWQRD